MGDELIMTDGVKMVAINTDDLNSFKNITIDVKNEIKHTYKYA